LNGDGIRLTGSYGAPARARSHVRAQAVPGALWRRGPARG
jgi:hypothetical protein